MDRLLKGLGPDEQKGSKPRCHWLTHGAPEMVAGRLSALAEPWGFVSAEDSWMPEGFCQAEEAQMDKAWTLLPPVLDRTGLRDWWLAVPGGTARTPTWDIASTCKIDGRKGFLLVEAKAHTRELKREDGVGAGPANAERIARCIREANSSLSVWTGHSWALSHEHRYQMANRFAWSWKLTQLGYPVVLVYLGFLGAEEMREGRDQFPFACHAYWERHVKQHSEPLFPAEIWDSRWWIHDQPFVPRVCSMTIRHDGPIEDE